MIFVLVGAVCGLSIAILLNRKYKSHPVEFMPDETVMDPRILKKLTFYDFLTMPSGLFDTNLFLKFVKAVRRLFNLEK